MGDNILQQHQYGNLKSIQSLEQLAAYVIAKKISKTYQKELETLCKQGLNLAYITQTKKTFLTLAVSCRNLHAIETLLKHGADINQRDENGKTPLITAIEARTCRLTIIKLLVSSGADANVIDKHKKSALMIAREKGYKEVVELLASPSLFQEEVEAKNQLFEAIKINDRMGIDKLLTSEKAITPIIRAEALNRAIKGCKIALVKEMLSKYKIDLNISDSNDEFPLIQAVLIKRATVVSTLLYFGADKEVKSKDGKTALMIAKEKGYQDIVMLLESDSIPKVNLEIIT